MHRIKGDANNFSLYGYVHVKNTQSSNGSSFMTNDLMHRYLLSLLLLDLLDQNNLQLILISTVLKS